MATIHLEIDVVFLGVICGLFLLCLILEAIVDLLRIRIIKKRTSLIKKSHQTQAI